MISEEISKKSIRLLVDQQANLPEDLTLRLKNENLISVSKCVTLKKEDAYTIYKTRAFLLKQQEAESNVKGYEDLLSNLEGSSYEKILVLGIQIKGYSPMLLFCDENFIEILGIIRAD